MDEIVLPTLVIDEYSNADAFRLDFGIDSLAQAQAVIDNSDQLFAAHGQDWENDRAYFDETAQEVKRYFEEGRYKEGELAESKPSEDGMDLWGDARHAANDSHDWKAVCSTPDFCKVGNAVVPFDSFATIGNQTQSSPDVKAQGVPVYRVGDMHKGVQGDAGSHIVAGTSLGGGYVKFLQGQDNVKVNGIPLVRQDNLCLVNCNAAGVGGALGKVVTTQRSADSQAEKPAEQETNPQLQALLDAEADERSFWEKTKEFGSGAWSSTKRIANASADDPLDTGVGVLKGIGNLPSDLWNLVVMASKYSSAGGMPSIAMQANAMEKAALAAHQAGDLDKANELARQANEMMNSGYVGDIFEPTSDAQKGGAVLSMFVPLGAAAKGAGALGKAARGAKALDAAADTVKAADVVADAGKAEHISEAAKTANTADEASKAADASKTNQGKSGVQIKKRRLKANHSYEYNGYKYTTDAEGRISSVEGKLSLKKAERNEYAQRTVGKDDGRLADDQGGHLIGSQFNGFGGKENLTPMHKSINNYHSGEWGQMEKNWASELAAGNDVQVKIKLVYGDSSARATEFRITETIGGVSSKRTIVNPTGP
ncbi:DNA/RNA non-specific endonuclease [Pseudomonas sp. LRF_L74]|uniref:DNA/RNA non-specific endonuclease n=1 Tax=Pseudomonas sp. LRF_L74 TaxID=3369422 RepID=UPI003F5FB2CF